MLEEQEEGNKIGNGGIEMEKMIQKKDRYID